MTTTTVNGKFGDFKDGTNGAGTPDYVYDNNGNLVIDLNKNVQNLVGANGITYNYLDKPTQIKIVGKGIIKIVYSADGEKLQRVFIPETAGQTATITTYVHEFTYQETSTTLTAASQPPFSGSNLALGFINFEEGRIRVITSAAINNANLDFLTVNGNLTLPNSKMGVYDYFITDYQENVRMIVTEEIRVAGNTATMEDARNSVETPIFGQTGAANEVTTTRVDKPSGWTNNSSLKVSRLGNLAGKNLGPNTLQKVMAGDAVLATTNYYFQSTTGGTNTNLPNLILGNLLQLLTGGGAAASLVKDNAGAVTSALGGNTGFISAVQPPGGGGTRPQAFLTILFFDERFNLVSEADGGVYQQQVAGTWSVLSSSLTIPSVKAPKNGYVYVYLSNRSEQHVYFDDFKVQITNGNILEENHYYSYGLKIAGISSKRITDSYDGLAKNNYLYNDKELWDEGDLNWYDYGFRNYDPQIGRFTQLDPLTDDYPMMTPYQYASCDPILNIDLDGLEGVAANAVKKSNYGVKVIQTAEGIVYQSVKKLTAGEKIWGALKTIGNVAKDFVPFASGIINIYEGVRDGNGMQALAGAGEVLFDLATFGVGSVAKGVVKTAVKEIVKQEVKQIVKAEAKTIVKKEVQVLTEKVVKKVDDAEGIIYKRVDKTGKQKDYIGQAKSNDRYKARQKEHQRSNKDADYEFTEIDRGKPGKELNQKEQKHLDRNGGPTNKSNPNGGTSNKKNVIKILKNICLN